MKKVLYVRLCLAIMACFCFCIFCFTVFKTDNKADASKAFLTSSDWEGCYGNYGVSQQNDGLQIEFNGRTAKGYNDDYFEINLSIVYFQASEWDTDHYSKDIMMQYCFINDNTYDINSWPWGSYPYNGIYILTRNWEGWLQLEINVKTDSGVTRVHSLAYAEPYEYANQLRSIVLQKEDAGYSLFIDGAEYADAAMANLTHGFLCDESGKTYFAYQSWSPNPDGTDRTFVLKSIYSPDIIFGQDDYTAPLGLGLTAKKYSANVTQHDDKVVITSDTLLYTSLTTDSIIIDGSVNGFTNGEKFRISFSSNQNLYNFTKNAPFYIDIENDGEVFFSVNGLGKTAVDLDDDFTLKITLIENVYVVELNEAIIETAIGKADISGDYGTFISYALNDLELEIYSIKNPLLYSDVKNPDNWNSPYNGITKVGEDTVIFADSTYDSKLDNGFVSFEFEIKGLLDSASVSSYICIALLTENKIDPMQPSSYGLVVMLRIYDDYLQFRLLDKTELMGTIEIYKWTEIDIDPYDRIKLIFLNDPVKDTYRIFFNDIEVVGDKMNEIVTMDASNRDGGSYLATACWHDTSMINEDVFEERSFIVYSLDNVYDEEDIPDVLRYIGKTETNTTNNTQIDDDSEEDERNGGIIIPVIILAIGSGLGIICIIETISKKKKK